MDWQALIAALKALGIDLPVDLTDPRLTPEKLAEHRATLEAKYQEIRTSGNPDLSALRSIRSAQGGIDERTAVIVAEAAELAQLDEAGKPKAADPVEPEGGEGDGGEGDGDGDETGADDKVVDTKDAPGTVIVGASTGDEKPPVDTDLAKVAGLQAPADQAGAGGGNTRPRVAWHQASAALMGAQNIGAEIGIESIGPRLTEIARQMSSMPEGRQLDRVVLASLPGAEASGYPDAGLVSMNKTATHNTEIIKERLRAHGEAVHAARTGEAVKTAAAPWCEPLDIIREIPNNVNTETPVFNSLPFQPMGYGGFTFNSGVSLGDLNGAVDIWTSADQAAIDPSDPDTWKICLALTCPGALPQVVLDKWLTACLEWQVGMDLNNPERFRDFFFKLEARRARLKEQYTLSLMDVLMKNYKNDTATMFLALGGVNDLIASILSMFQGSAYTERTNDRSGYTMYLDTDIIDTLVVAEAGAAYAKTEATRAAVINYILAKVPMLDRVVQALDRVPGAFGTVQADGNPKAAFPADNAAVVAVPAMITAGRIRIVPTAEVFAFGTGELRTGVTQEFSYARMNKVGWFAEEAFALTKYGTQPWFALNATISPQGWYVGAINRQITTESTPFPAFTAVTDNAAADQPDPLP